MKKERGNFRPIYTAIWDDPEFQSFDSDTKVVFFNLRSSRFGNWPCIYVMYPTTVAEQTSIPLKKVMGSLMTLSERSWIAHVPPVIWVIKGLRNDPNWNPANEKQVRGIEEQLRSLPKNPLLSRFCKFYGLSFSWVPGDDSIDNPIDRPTDDPIHNPMEGTYTVSRKPEAVSHKEHGRASRFTPPTFEEVKAYCKERKNGIDPQSFIDKNKAVGWVVGKTCKPMRDWKAAMRTWENHAKAEPERKHQQRECYYPGCTDRNISKTDSTWHCREHDPRKIDEKDRASGDDFKRAMAKLGEIGA